MKPNSPFVMGAPLCVLTLALLVTGLATQYVAQTARDRDQKRFDDAVRATESAIRERLDACVALLHGTRGYMIAAGTVKRQGFHDYIASLDLPRRYPGVQGIGISLRMMPDQVGGITRLLHEREGMTGFRVWPAQARDEYHAIIFLEPADPRNVRALGYDMYTEGERRATMELARDTGLPATTGRVTLIQEIDDQKQAGFLIYLPVYGRKAVLHSRAQRRAALVGFVFSPFRADDLLRALFSKQERRLVDFDVYDGAAINAERLLHRSAAVPRGDGKQPEPRLTDTRTLTLPGRRWTLAFGTRAEFDRDSHRSLTPFVLVGGLIISLLLFGVTWLETRGRLVAERISTELRLSEEALRQADRAKDEFLAMLGHELRNPLAAVTNALHVMRLRGTPDPLVQRAREVAERQVQHQTRLLADLLDVARVTAGKITLQREPLDLGQVAAQALEALAAAAAERNQEVTLSRDGPVVVEGDATRLEQVVTNLIQNAITYTPPGGRIQLAIEAQDREAILRVRDNGTGIAPEILPRIFELFAQAPMAPDRSSGGLGLGLTIVRRLVEMHGGRVSARSEGPGQGSEFTVRLPLLEGGIVPALPTSPPALPAAGVPPLATAPPAAAPRGRILIIEDNRDTAETLRDLLTGFGYEVAVAMTGTSGLAAARETRPEVVLCDIGLPGMDGYSVAAALRRDPATASVRLIAVSGYGQEEDLRRSREAGFDVHLIKPVDLPHLEQLLATTPEGS